MAWNWKTFIWFDLYSGELVLQDNNWINGMWHRDCTEQYFYIGLFSNDEEADTHMKYRARKLKGK